MKATLIFIAKVTALWVAMMIGQIVSGMILLAFAKPPLEGHDGPLSVMQALPIVAALHAVVLAMVADHLRGTRLTRALVTFCLYYVVAYGLSLIEAWYFNGYLKLDPQLLIGMGFGDLARSILVGLAAFVLWPTAGGQSTALTGLLWKVPLLAGLYIVFYFGAGALIAFQSAVLRAYYQQGLHIDQGQLAGLQAGRGLIWAGLAATLAARLGGPRLSRAALTGAAFAVLMAAALLPPTTFMPWEVRLFHMMELTASNFIYGVLAALIMLTGSDDKIQSD